MSSLREIKDRIGSVRSTLKITNAMKLVSSAKLRKAQQAIEALRPYEATLSGILADAQREVPCHNRAKTSDPPGKNAGGPSKSAENVRASGRVAVVTVASNSSLCGSFNGNVLRKTLEVLRGASLVDVYPIGRRIADPLRKSGYPAADGMLPSGIDLNELAAHPSYEAAAELAQSLADAYAAGVYTKVILIYNHFVSSSRQDVVCETYLPFDMRGCARKGAKTCTTPEKEEGLCTKKGENVHDPKDYILEPSAADITKTLLPQVMRLKIYAMLLDSAAAEHAARMIAMQTATDNAQDILDELTLEYNKGRQQQITAEILDIVGGSQQ